MKVYIFLYNVVALKANLSKLKTDKANQKFVLIGSSYALRDLSRANYDCMDEIHQIPRDFHQIDYASVNRIIQQYVDDYGVKNIRLLTNEDSTQLVCAQLRELYRIPGDNLANILPFVNKVISKSCLNGVVSVPNFVEFDKLQYKNRDDSYLNTITQQLGFPMFAKPIDLTSSIGTYKINDFATLQDVANKIYKSPYAFEVDEFISGDLFHCDVIMYDGNTIFFMAAQYAFPLANFSKGQPMGSIPVADQQLFRELREFTDKVIKQLRCRNGAYHLEVYLEDKSQELVFLEIAARTAGALVPRFYEAQFGFHIEELHYRAQMEQLDDFKMRPSNKFAGWITYPKLQGTVIDIKEPHLDIHSQVIDKLVNVGDVNRNAESLLDAALNVVFWDDSWAKVQKAFETLKQCQPLQISIDGDNQVAQPRINLEHHFEVVEELFNVLPFVFWKSRAGKYLGCNSNQAKAFNFNSPSEFIGKTIYEVIDNQEEAKIIDEIDNKIMSDGVSRIVEEQVYTRQGVKIFLSQKQPLRDKEGRIMGLLGFAMDITELKAQQKQIEEINKKLMYENSELEVENNLTYVNF